MSTLLNHLKFLLRLLTLDREAYAVLAWRRGNGDSTLRLNYPLTKESVVLDVGGYTGDWADEISRRYGAKIYVFEPLPKHIAGLRERFASQNNVSIADYGLGIADGVREIALCGDGSGALREGNCRTQCRFRDVLDVFNEIDCEMLDLVKINIEGDEYDLLERIIDSGWITRCHELQIQFHSFVPNAEERKEKLRKLMSRTHQLTYDFYFVWENWRLLPT